MSISSVTWDSIIINVNLTNQMKNYFILTLLVLVQIINLTAQNEIDILPPDGGGSPEFKADDHITESQRKEILNMLSLNIKQLQVEGIIDTNTSATTALISNFQWPLKQASGFNYNSYYGISNYVDHNSNYPNAITDYNCGTRSYDTNSGYNHRGIDIYTWPFSWDMMDDNQVEVIAGAPGVIIGKDDGNYDKNCNPTGTWNAVYIRHSDGSEVWYGHLKTGSLTAKNVGASVTTGEYLGVVGSSGQSTGPHLHLEMYASNGALVDPYSGSCNNLNSSSLWANQKPYYESTLNTILTHSAPPSANQCYPDASNKSTNFTAGATVYFGTYYHDYLANQVTNLRIYQPDNSLWTNWSHSSNASSYFSAAYWYWTFTLPTNPQNGQWRFEATYQGQTLTHYFNVTGGSGGSPNLICRNRGSVNVNGTTITISNFQVENAGTATANSSYLGYYLSTNTIISTSDYYLGRDYVSALTSGQYSTESFTVDVSNITPAIPDGTYYIGFLIDYQNVVSESSESDNNDCYWTSPTLNLSSCVNSITITDTYANNTYRAAQSISTTGLVNVTGNGVFKAGQSVTLNSGFQASLGCDFLASIENCQNNLSEEDIAESRFTDATPSNPDLSAKIYPNPTLEVLNIEVTKQEQGFELELYDIMGRQLHTWQVANNQTTITVHHLSEGVYFLRIDSELIQKFVVGRK